MAVNFFGETKARKYNREEVYWYIGSKLTEFYAAAVVERKDNVITAKSVLK